MEVNIRSYNSSDYSSVERILRDSKLFYPRMDSQHVLEGHMKLHPGTIFVAESSDGEILGTLRSVDGSVASLHRLGVDSRYRGNGIGKSLFDYAEQSLKRKQVEEINLFVELDKPHLVEMYERWGYNLAKERFVRMSKVFEY